MTARASQHTYSRLVRACVIVNREFRIGPFRHALFHDTSHVRTDRLRLLLDNPLRCCFFSARKNASVRFARAFRGSPTGFPPSTREKAKLVPQMGEFVNVAVNFFASLSMVICGVSAVIIPNLAHRKLPPATVNRSQQSVPSFEAHVPSAHDMSCILAVRVESGQ